MVDLKFILAPLPTRAYANCSVVYPIACIRTNTVDVELPNGIGWQIRYIVQPGAQEDVIVRKGVKSLLLTSVLVRWDRNGEAAAGGIPGSSLSRHLPRERGAGGVP